MCARGVYLSVYMWSKSSQLNHAPIAIDSGGELCMRWEVSELRGYAHIIIENEHKTMIYTLLEKIIYKYCNLVRDCLRTRQQQSVKVHAQPSNTCIT